MSARVNFVKSKLEKIYNKLNESYEYVNIIRLENDNRFIKIFELIVEISTSCSCKQLQEQLLKLPLLHKEEV